jgi:hypothetical protein
VVVQSLPDVVDVVPSRHRERRKGFASHRDVLFVAAYRCRAVLGQIVN